MFGNYICHPCTEGYYYEEKWTESENSITQSWELIEIPPETDVDPYEAMQILFGE